MPTSAGRRAHDTSPAGASPGSPGVSGADSSASDATRPIGQVLRDRWWVVTLCLLLAGAGGAAYFLQAEPLYESTARLLIPEERPTPSADDAVVGDSAYTGVKLASQGALLRSRPVLQRALQDPRVATAQGIADSDRPADRLADMLDVDAESEEEILSVSVRGPDAEEAAAITNAVVEAFIQQQRAQRQMTAEAAVRQLRSTLGTQKLDLPTPDAADAPPADLATDDSTIIPSAEHRRTVALKLGRLAEQLLEAQLVRYDAESLLEAAKAADGDPGQLRQLVAAAQIDDERSDWMVDTSDLVAEYDYAVRQRAELGRTLGQNHRTTKLLDDRVVELRSQMLARNRALVEGLFGRLEQNYKSAAHREAELQAAYLEQEAIAARMDTIPAVVLDPAVASRFPVSPSLPRTGIVALLLGLMAGVGGAFAIEELSRGGREATAAARAEMVDEPDDLAHHLQAPLLGVVPRADHPPARRQDSLDAEELDPAVEEEDQIAGAIHQARVLLQIQSKRHGERTFSLTSSDRGCGNTSVAVGLGSSLAMSGTRTLLIDGDIAGRMARLDGLDIRGVASPGSHEKEGAGHELTKAGESGRVGITAALEGVPLDRCVMPSNVPGLDILPVVAPRPGHIASLSGNAIRGILDQALQTYEMVLIDTGPIGQSVEALVMASEADGVVVICTPGTTRAKLDKALGYLRMCGAKVVGTIFNAATPAPAPGHQTTDRKRVKRRNGMADRHARDGGSGILAAAVYSNAGLDAVQPPTDAPPAGRASLNGHRSAASGVEDVPASAMEPHQTPSQPSDILKGLMEDDDDADDAVMDRPEGAEPDARHPAAPPDLLDADEPEITTTGRSGSLLQRLRVGSDTFTD